MHFLLKEEFLVNMSISSVYLGWSLPSKADLKQFLILLLQGRFKAVDFNLPHSEVTRGWELAEAFNSNRRLVKALISSLDRHVLPMLRYYGLRPQRGIIINYKLLNYFSPAPRLTLLNKKIIANGRKEIWHILPEITPRKIPTQSR